MQREPIPCFQAWDEILAYKLIQVEMTFALACLVVCVLVLGLSQVLRVPLASSSMSSSLILGLPIQTTLYFCFPPTPGTQTFVSKLRKSIATVYKDL